MPSSFPFGPRLWYSTSLPEDMQQESLALIQQVQGEVPQKLKLRTRKYSASETQSQEHVTFQHYKVVGWKENVHFWF